MVDVMPTPPGFLSRVDLSGPYDADIPAAKAHQIKSAGLVLDWAVPYIFLSVAARFESEDDEKKSLAFYDRAIDEFHKRNNVFGAATAWRRKMAALQGFGHDTLVLKSLRDMDGRREGGLPAAFVAFSHGHFYAQSGDYSKAKDYFGRALLANADYAGHPDLTALRRDTELEYGMALILADYFPIVARRLFLADFDEAFYREIRRNVTAGLTYLERARILNADVLKTKASRYFPEIAPPHVECDIENYLGLAFGIQGQTQRARYHLDQAGNLARQSGYHLGKADGIFFLNQVYLLSQNTPEGKKAAYSLANIADQYSLLPYAIWSKMILAHHDRRAGDMASALRSLRGFLDIMDKNASWLSRFADFRRVDHFQRRPISDVVFDFYVQGGDVQNAFSTAERIKAAPFTEAFEASVFAEKPGGRPLIDQLSLSREQQVRNYQRLLSREKASAVFLKMAESAGYHQKDYLNCREALKKNNEGLYALMYADPLTAQEIQRLLDVNTTLFSYYATDRWLYVWAISQKGIHLEKINMSRPALEGFVRDYHQTLRLKDKSQIDAFAEKAYDMFLKPVIPFVHGDRVCIIPHGALFQLPFASMNYMKSYLVNVFSLFYLPHAAMLKGSEVKTDEPRSKNLLMIVASPSAGETAVRPDAVVEGLKRSFPKADYFMQAHNPRDGFLKRSGNYNMIYFAAECYLTDKAPLGSGFLLSSGARQGGYVNVSDVCGLNLKARTSVIRTCLTENGLPSEGPGVSGLARCLIYAVSPAVVMPLWAVDEKAVLALTDSFQKHFEKRGDAAEALRAAQNEMILAGFNPAEWSAFILVGRH